MPASPGVLILHGFTAGRASVEPLVPRVEALGLPWRLPQLRGHWTKPEDLVGVRYEDMRDDALAALEQLHAATGRVTVVGLSVGGTIALDLAAEQQDKIESLAVLVPALRYVSPLAPFSSLIARVLVAFHGDGLSGYSDAKYSGRSGNYDVFPTKTFASIYEHSRRVEKQLPRIRTPLLVLGARRDRVIQPRCAQLVYNRVAASEKAIVWYERTGHEMLLDCEADAIADRVGAFLKQRVNREHASR